MNKMSGAIGILSRLTFAVNHVVRTPIIRSFYHTMNNWNGTLGKGNSLLVPTNVLTTPPSRTQIRVFFPRPSELKRVKRHGWKARMSTPGGRQVIMRRMLKGRHCLTH